jgi:trehalose synthase
MATGDAGPIRLIMELVLEKDLDLGMFVHALQNHDELMFNITHLRTHGDEEFSVNGRVMTGQQIYESMYERAKLKVMRKQSLIQEFSNLGFCGTLAAYSAAALEVNNPNKMSALEQSAVQNLHFLAAAFNAMLPGVFALSGWDMVGALLVDEESLGSWMDDRDGRWMNRGAYDLMGINPEADYSRAGLPKAIPIYGSLTDQLSKPKSFVSQLQRMLRARKASRIAFSKLVAVPEVVVESIVVLLFERPEGQGWIITTFNFGQEPAHDIVRLPQMAGRTARLMFSTSGEKVKVIPISHMGGFELDLAPVQGEMFIVE